MPDALVIALIAGPVVTAITILSARITALEKRLTQLDAENDLIWLWARRLLDHYYRYRRADAPDPPEPPPGIRGHE